MKRTELKRKTPLRAKAPARHALAPGLGRGGGALKRGRGFQASPAQREKVRGMACANCGYMGDDYAVIDPAHVCSRGMGGCDDEACVIPLCRHGGPDGGCHRAFDRGELDLIAKLEPSYRAELAHALLHMGLENLRIRLAPSCYRGERDAA